MKILVKILINTAIGLGLVFVWLQFVDIKEIIQQLKAVDLIFIWPIFLCFFTGIVIRSIKIKLFLSKVAVIPLKDLIFLTGAAMLFNYIIPIRAGEVLKGIYLGTNYKLSLSKSVIWIFLDRFIDFLTVLILSAVLLLLIPTSLSINFVIIITVIFLTVVLISFLMVVRPNFIKAIYKLLSFLLVFTFIKVAIGKFLDHLLESFSILKRPGSELLSLFILSALAYAADAGVSYFVILALNNRLDLIKIYLSQLLSALTYLVPAGPGYVGSAEASGLLIFSGIFGMDPNTASAITVLFHIISVIWIIVFGVICVYFLKIKPAKIFKKILVR